MAKKKPGQTNGQKLPTKLKFDYIKSNYHRVVHSDGIWGGVTPRQGIIMSFWSERSAIPKQVAHEITPEGKLGSEIKDERDVRDAIVREIEVTVSMDLPTAKAVLTWLKGKIDVAEKLASDNLEK